MDIYSTDSAQDAADVDPFRYTPAEPPLSEATATPVEWSPAMPAGDNGGPPLIPKRLHNRLSIVGFADGHRNHAPWDLPDMEFWGINRLHAVLEGKPWTRWFEIHSLADFYRDDQQHQTWMKQAGIPIYVRPQDMITANEWGIDNATPYPIERILTAFQPGYFTNTISWLLALAIAMQFEEIHLYGVDMAQDHVLQNEYSHQRPSCEWLIGLAQGRGIRVVLPPGSDLLKASHLYGFDTDTYQHQSQAGWFQARISELDGAMQEVGYNLRNLVTPSAAIPEGKHEQS